MSWTESLREKQDRDHLSITCGFFIFNPSQQVLICLPYGSGNVWTIPKGKQDPGESHLQTAIRETQEETGIQLQNYNGQCFYIGTELYRHGKKRLHAFAYLLPKNISTKELRCSTTINGTDHPEIQDFRFTDCRQACNLLHPTQAALLELIKDGAVAQFPTINIR